MLCVIILYMSAGNYSLKSAPNSRRSTRRIWRIFHCTFIYFQSFHQKSSERKTPISITDYPAGTSGFINWFIFASIVIILYISSVFIITIIQQIFMTEIFKPQLFSSHATCLHTRLTEFFLNFRCLLCLAFYITWLKIAVV